MTHTTTYKRPWFSYIQGHKARYLGYGLVVMWGIIMILDHDLDIWLKVRSGIYDANALGQLYFKQLDLSGVGHVMDGLFVIMAIMVVYAILIGIARHKYNNA